MTDITDQSSSECVFPFKAGGFTFHYLLCVYVREKKQVVTLANMRLLTCVTVVSVVNAIGRAALVPYTLGDTTIMVDSSILGYNSPLLSYLSQGMAHRRNDNTESALQVDSPSQSGDFSQETVRENEKQSSDGPETSQQFASNEVLYTKTPVKPQTEISPQDMISQEAVDKEFLSSGTADDELFVSHADFQTNPEGELAIKVMPGKNKFDLSGNLAPITVNEAAGIYVKGERVPIEAEDNNPPLYYKVPTPNFADVSEKIHNIVTSFSPKLNDRAPGPSHHSLIPNAIPLQLHARPGDTPPSLANTEGFTGVSVKHMVPEEPNFYEDSTTNNGDLTFLLSSDPLMQSDLHPKPFKHDGPSLLPGDKPVGTVWGSKSDMLQHTQIHDDDEHSSSVSVMDLELKSSSNDQDEDHELPASPSNSDADKHSVIETEFDVSEIMESDRVKLNNEESTTLLPEVVDTAPITEAETSTVPPAAEKMDKNTEKENTLTSSVPQVVEYVTLTTEESYNVTPVDEEEHTVISPVDGDDKVIYTKDGSSTTASTVIDLSTSTVRMDGMDTVTGAEELETTTPSVELNTEPTEETVTVDWDNFLSTKMKELQREEIQEAVLGAEEEEDQVALDEAMADLLTLFSTSSDENDTQTSGESEADNWQNNSSFATEAYRESDTDNIIMTDDKESYNDQSDVSLPTTTFQTLLERHTSDSMTSFPESFEASFTDRGEESNHDNVDHPTQNHFHYSAVANFPITRDEPERQSPDQQGAASLRHDLPHSSDQQGLKSWFDREPITIFDPLHAPRPGAPLPQGVDDLQLATDIINDKHNSETTVGYIDSRNNSTAEVTPQSGNESNESDTSTRGDSDNSSLTENEVSVDSTTPLNDTDLDVLGTLQSNDDSEESSQHEDSDNGSDISSTFEEDGSGDSDDSTTSDSDDDGSSDQTVLNDDGSDDSAASNENGSDDSYDDSDDSMTFDDDDDDDDDLNDSTMLNDVDSDSNDSAAHEDNDVDNLATPGNDTSDSDDSENSSDDDDASAMVDDNNDDSLDSATTDDDDDNSDYSTTSSDEDEDEDSDDSATLPDIPDIRQTGQSSLPPPYSSLTH